MIWIKEMLRTLAIAMAGLAALTGPGLAQQSGWHYSPLPGEGDRAAMGCGYGASAETFACLVVRCEDDFTVGVHLHTSRPGGDVGRWDLEFDKGDPRLSVEAVADGSPYGAKIEGDVTAILDAIRNGAMVFLEPASGPGIERAISLSGSLYVVNQALYFCAPKVTPQG